MAHLGCVAFALAKENEEFIAKMLRAGRFNNQSEVVREALRRMERDESSYLNPPPLTPSQLKEIYEPNQAEDRLELQIVKATQASLRKAAKRLKSIDDL